MRNDKRVKVTAALAGVVALLLVAATPLGHPALRLKASPSTVWDDSDPTVLVEGTHTYLFGSSNNRKVPVRQITSYSASLATSQADWAAHSADAMPTRPAWVNPAKWQIWAPSVIKIGTQFLMYFASHNAAATTDMSNDQCIGRAVSSSPMGPYRPSAAPLYCGLPAEGAVGGLPASNRYGRGAARPRRLPGPRRPPLPDRGAEPHQREHRRGPAAAPAVCPPAASTPRPTPSPA